MAEQIAENTARRPGTVALWGGWGLAAAGWALHLGVSYGMVEWYCHSDTGMSPDTIYRALNATTLVSVSLALLGIILAWRNARRTAPENTATPEGFERKRFMAIAGMLLSLLFLGIILMQGLPNFILEPCQ